MRLFVAVFLLLSASLSIQDQSAQNSHGEANVKQPQSTDGATSPSVHTPETQTQHYDSYDPRKDCLYRVYLAATIFGVFAALGGIYAIYTQTEATKQAAEATAESAKATRDSVTLQEIALKQWVNIGHWEAWIDKPTTQLRIRFHIINPTKLPIDLHMILIKIGTAPGGEQHQDTGVADVLAPDNPYIADASIELSDEQIATLTDGEIVVISLKCSVFFADSRKQHWEQIFERFVVVDKNILNSGDPNVVTPFTREVRNQLRPSDVKH